MNSIKKICVTGGAGFIGSNFVRHILKNRDYEIVNVDKLTYAGNLKNCCDIEKSKNYKFIQGDIGDLDFLNTIFVQEKFDAIINFAAETHVDRSIKDSDPFISANILGVHNLLKCAVKFKIKRFHQISTDEVFGDLGDNSTDFFTEKTPLAPNCPYAAAKASGDLLVQSWEETYGLNTIITRCSNNYGPYQFPEKLIPFFLFKAMKSEDLTVYGNGLNIRDWLYVIDHCEAILLAFEKSASKETWNIGGHNEKTNLEIVELILKSVPNSKSKIVFIEDRKAHDRRYAMDATKIREKLGWRPKHTFEEALPKTIKWYLDNQEWVNQCRKKV
jgi:dTDP-glucose 4,6-dehydratase